MTFQHGNSTCRIFVLHALLLGLLTRVSLGLIAADAGDVGGVVHIPAFLAQQVEDHCGPGGEGNPGQGRVCMCARV